MINFDTPSSNFIILLPDDWDANLKSDLFNFKEVSIKGQTFLFLSLFNDNLITSKDLSDEFQIDLQNIIPLGTQNNSNFDKFFFITGYSQNDFKFNEYKAFLQQISPKIQVFDNISVIEANTENCKEEDISTLSTFLPILYPHLSFTPYIPKRRIRIFITNNKPNMHSISQSIIKSLLKWDNMISQIYFNSNKTIADIVLNEEGEKNYKQLYQRKVISTEDYTLTICKFADMIKINKCKSLELKAENFPFNFTLEDAYKFFSENKHIYRIQIFNENDMKKYVIIQLTSKRIYNNLLHQKTLRYQTRIITIKPSHIKHSDSKSDTNDNEKETRNETSSISKNNRRISPLNSRKFIDDVGDDEIYNENTADNFLDKGSEVTKITSHHTARYFIEDNEDSDDHIIVESSSDELSSSNLLEETREVTKSEVNERGINMHLVKEIHTKSRHRRNHLFISDSYSENYDDEDTDASLSNKSNNEFLSSSRFSDDLIRTKSGGIESVKKTESPTFIQEIVHSLSHSRSNSSNYSDQSNVKNVNFKSNRMYISDEDDNDEVVTIRNENEELNMNEKKSLVQNSAASNNNVERKFVILKTEIDDIGSYSYSDAYTEYGSFSDSD